MMIPHNLYSRKIAVLLGGRSRERAVSLRSGRKILASLKKQGFRAFPFDLDKKFFRAVLDGKIDLVFIALHGTPGEDGTVQGFLEIAGIPYTGCGVLASALAMDKVATKKILLAEGLPTQDFFEFDNYRPLRIQLKEMFTRLDLPLVVKPVTEGSSIGVTIVKDLAKLKKVLKATMAEFGRVFAEKYIQGREVTVGVIGSGRAVKVLPVLELLPKADFYNYQAKYTQGGTELVVPAKFSLRLTRKIQMVALRTFRALGADGVSRIDIIVKGEHLYVHDVNTIPGMTDLSDLPAAAAAAGISYDQLVLEILLSAFQRRH